MVSTGYGIMVVLRGANGGSNFIFESRRNTFVSVKVKNPIASGIFESNVVPFGEIFAIRIKNGNNFCLGSYFLDNLKSVVGRVGSYKNQLISKSGRAKTWGNHLGFVTSINNDSDGYF